MSAAVKAAIKYPGSKWRLAEWIVGHFPPHEIYLEPFFGSGAVFFTKSEAKLEVINDIDSNVVNFFKVCREQPAQLARALDYTPFSREEFEAVQEVAAGEPLQLTGDALEDARRFAVRCWQGTGNRLGQRVGWKNDVTQTKSNTAHHWERLPERIEPIARRLKRAEIEHTDALGLIQKFKGSGALIYADPPYIGETRQRQIYREEMTGAAEHETLLKALLVHDGPVILSGYDSELYNDMLGGWSRDSIDARTQSNAVKKEILWYNYKLQLSIFDI